VQGGFCDERVRREWPAQQQQQQQQQETSQVQHHEQARQMRFDGKGDFRGAAKDGEVSWRQKTSSSSRYDAGISTQHSSQEPSCPAGLLPMAANCLDMADAIEISIAATGQAHAAVAYRKHAGRVLQAAAIVSRRLAGQAAHVQQRHQAQLQPHRGSKDSILADSSNSSSCSVRQVVGSRLCLLCGAGDVPRVSGSKPGVHLYFYVV
jgi:hypothetical protein